MGTASKVLRQPSSGPNHNAGSPGGGNSSPTSLVEGPYVYTLPGVFPLGWESSRAGTVLSTKCFREELMAQPGQAGLWRHGPALRPWSVCEALAPSVSPLSGVILTSTTANRLAGWPWAGPCTLRLQWTHQLLVGETLPAGA